MNSRFLRYTIIIIGIILIASTSKATIDLWRIGDWVSLREAKVRELEMKNEEIRKKIAEAESPNYLEKVARDKLNLAKQGEYVVILPKANEATASAETIDPRPNWQKWQEIIF